MAKRANQSPKRITRDDLERGFRQLQGDVLEKVEEQRSTWMSGIAVAGVLIIVFVFLLGRRSGRKKNTIVEIRRV